MATISEALANATQHHQAGDFPTAERIYLQILAVDPNHVDALHLLGVVDFQMGKHDAAVEHIRRAIALNENEAAFHSNLGSVLKAQGRLDDAIGSFRRALELNAHDAAAHYNLGNTLQSQGKLDEAVVCFQRALALRSDYEAAHNNLGTALLALGKPDVAVASIRRALELHPEFPEAHYNLGTFFEAQGNLEEAIVCYRRAIELQPGLAAAHYNLGTALQGQQQANEAAAAYRRAVELRPDNAAAYNNLGTALQALGKLDEAADCFSRVLELEPECAEAHGNQSSLMLLRADFQRGWPEYEWRWKADSRLDRKFSQLRWDGKPLEGRTILLHAEQGLGDTFQFIRYAAVVKKQNPAATVVVECPRALEKLIARCAGIDRLIAEGDELPPFDVHSALLSLPGILKTAVETIPADIPYLFAEAALVANWRERLSKVGGLRVGINWQGRPGKGEFSKRDIPIEHFAALAQVPGVCLVSLQKSASGDALDRGSDLVPMIDLYPDFDSNHGPFMDTAAVMTNLDLVITSDTSVPNLAGGLGIPVWLALPFVPNWRWLLDRADSPWYPTMRLFRQKTPGDWSVVFDEIRNELHKLALSRS